VSRGQKFIEPSETPLKCNRASCSSMKNLSLAVFNTQPPFYLGGVERRIIETAKRMQAKVSFTVYTGTKGGLRKPTRLDGLTMVPCFSSDAIFPLDNWTFNQTLARNACSIKADVYEAHTASGYGLIGAFRRRGLNVPFVHTIHGVLADEYAQAVLRGGMSFRGRIANLFMWRLALLEAESARKATLVVTISKYSQEKIFQYYNVDSSKIRIVPNGVDIEKFRPTGDCEKAKRRIRIDNRQIVLFVGRLIPRKGVDYLIEAAKRIVKERKETLFVLVGNGPLRNSISAEVEKAGLKRSFVFLGDVSEEELPQFYRCADVFVLPSIQEGQGIVLLEAQASGKPVVAFNVSGVAEAMSPGETGLLVKSTDSNALADAVLRLLCDDAMRMKMGVEGLRLVRKEFSWDVCAEKMVRVYREAMELAN
jgi:glycosyltransferase involved in cell wall biosynthesis